MAVRITQSSSGALSGTVLDGAGSPVAGSRITAATLTLYDVETAALDASPAEGIINGRERADLLSPSPAEITIDEQGAFAVQLTPDDNPIVTPRRQVERHRAVLIFTWPEGAYTTNIDIDVVNEALA